MCKWIKFYCLSLIFLTTNYIYSECPKDNLYLLFIEHGRLLNETMQYVPQFVVDSAKPKFQTNSQAIASIIRSAKGPSTAKIFEELLNQQILISSDYFEAIKSNNKGLTIHLSNQAKDNAHEIALFLTSLSPAVPYDTWQRMLDRYVSIEEEQAKAYFKRDFKRANQLKDLSLTQLGNFANLLSAALFGHRSFGNATDFEIACMNFYGYE